MTTIASTRSHAAVSATRPTPLAAAPDAAVPTDAFTPSGAPGEDTPAAQRKWTVLVYSAADNNLKPFMFSDLDECERVGSDANTHLVAQYDGGSAEGCKRLYLTKDATPNTLTSPVVGELGKRVDMADPKTLSEFIQWGMRQYPADHTMLLISDHGNGWRGCVGDDSAGSWMSLPELSQAVADARAATGKKLDVIGFDACLMASTEVAHQLRDDAQFLVASQETESAEGWPYTNILNPQMIGGMQAMLQNKIDLSPRELAAHVVQSAAGHQGDLPTMSAVDLAAMPALTSKLDGFAQAIMATETPKRELRSLARHTQGFYAYKDVFDFAERITNSTKVKDAALKSAAADLMEAVESTVFSEQHSYSYPYANGLSIELRKSPSGYEETELAKDTRWDEAMRHLYSWF